MFLTLVRDHSPGLFPAHFEVGRTYDVGTQLSSVLIAALPSPEPTVAIKGVVLVIDDEPDVQRLTQTLLARNGYHVVVAQHGKEGIELLQDHCPDLIVLDLNMPVMDGWQFRAPIVRGRGGRTPTSPWRSIRRTRLPGPFD